MPRLATAVVRALVLVGPLVAGASAASFGGCSNGLVHLAAPDAGSQFDLYDGSPIGNEDANAIYVPVDAGPDTGGPDVYDAGICVTENATLGAPVDLACTGLYSDFATKTIAPGVTAYDPGLHLWADGAAVSRWVLLPAGQTIDTSDMNEWSFPVGTRAWQEFQIGGTRVETRWYWKRGASDWVRGTYVWSVDGSSATYTTQGVANVDGLQYDVPPVTDCDTCHAGHVDRLLGIEAVSLAQPSASGVTLASLVSSARLTSAPTGSLVVPDDGTTLAAPALGWLHANCGTSCHSPSASASAAESGLFLRLEVRDTDAGQSLGDVYHTDTYVTSVNVAAQLSPFSSEGWHRITPNDPFDGGVGTSLLPFAAASRGVAGVQMPPIDTLVADVPDVTALRSWISQGSFPPGTF